MRNENRARHNERCQAGGEGGARGAERAQPAEQRGPRCGAVSRPVVMDASLGATPVTAAVSNASAAEAWTAVLRPLRLKAVDSDGAFHIVPAS